MFLQQPLHPWKLRAPKAANSESNKGCYFPKFMVINQRLKITSLYLARE